MTFGRGKKLYNEAELYEYAVGALGRRMRSVAELKRLLRRRVDADELGQTLVELVIARLKEQRYLNDAQYASAYSSLRRENDKFGRRRVITELKSRGVHSEVIEKAIAGAYENVNEEALARAYLRRKRMQQTRRRKAGGARVPLLDPRRVWRAYHHFDPEKMGRGRRGPDGAGNGRAIGRHDARRQSVRLSS